MALHWNLWFFILLSIYFPLENIIFQIAWIWPKLEKGVLNIDGHKKIKFTVYLGGTMVITFCSLMYVEIFTAFGNF